MTAMELLLQVATTLNQPFSQEELILAAWKAEPFVFGLAGHEPDHPDSNRVIATLVGARGPVARGLLIKVAPKTYALPSLPIPKAVSLPLAKAAPKPTTLRRDREEALQGLFATDAWHKHRRQQRPEITFQDAMAFWGESDVDLDAQVGLVGLGIAEIAGKITGETVQLSTGQVVPLADVLALGELHGWMEGRFQRHLTLIRKRQEKAVTA